MYYLRSQAPAKLAKSRFPPPYPHRRGFFIQKYVFTTVDRLRVSCVKLAHEIDSIHGYPEWLLVFLLWPDGVPVGLFDPAGRLARRKDPKIPALCYGQSLQILEIKLYKSIFGAVYMRSSCCNEFWHTYK